LITGAAGKTASVVAETLTGRGFFVRALVRKEDDRSKRLAGLGAEIVIGDMLSLADMKAATNGMDSAYFCYPTSDRILEASAIMAEAARENGMGFVCNMSQIIARSDAPSPTSRLHWLAERLFDTSPINVTHLKPTFFADHFVLNMRHTIAKDNQIIRPYGSAFHSPITSADIGRVAATVLIDPTRHIGKAYVLTGLDRLSFTEIADIFSEILQRPIVYIDVPADEFKADMERRQFANSLLEHHMQSSKDYRDGSFDATNTLVEDITGQQATRFRDYIRANLTSFQAA
jgi:NAD(P)H dehydrogenase (quinone)